jgi:hypothetical protein
MGKYTPSESSFPLQNRLLQAFLPAFPLRQTAALRDTIDPDAGRTDKVSHMYMLCLASRSITEYPV